MLLESLRQDAPASGAWISTAASVSNAVPKFESYADPRLRVASLMAALAEMVRSVLRAPDGAMAPAPLVRKRAEVVAAGHTHPSSLSVPSKVLATLDANVEPMLARTLSRLLAATAPRRVRCKGEPLRAPSDLLVVEARMALEASVLLSGGRAEDALDPFKGARKCAASTAR